MAYGNQAQEYRKNAVLGASPAQLVVMLYDGALRFIEGGRAAMRAKDLARQNEALQRAQRIVSELLGTLDHEKGGEIADKLNAIYLYSRRTLSDARIHRSPEKIDEVRTLLGEIRDSWAQICGGE